MTSISGMGADYERLISKKTALNLCGMYPLPRMGEEIVVAIKSDPDYSAFRLRLMVGNYSGRFVITSHDVKRSRWSDVFGVWGGETP